MMLRMLIIILFAVVSLILWFPALQDTQKKEPEKESALIPEFTAKFLHQELYDNEGQLKQEVFSQKMEHFSELSLTHFIKPEFILYQNQKPFWKLSSEVGNIQDGRLILEASVKMEQLDYNELVSTIRTEYLEINLKNNTVSTDNLIIIEGKTLTVSGQGLKADLNVGKVSLIKHVETIFKGTI